MADASAVNLGENWSDRLIHFIQHLRSRGFLVGPGETVDAFRAVEKVGLASETEVCAVLRTILCCNRSEQKIFDVLFHDFFQSKADSVSSKGTVSAGETAESLSQKKGAYPEAVTETELEQHDSDFSVGDATGTAEKENDQELSFLERARYSSEQLNRKQSLHISAEGLAEMSDAARLLISRFDLKTRRRWRLMRQGQRLDFRRTFRKNIEKGSVIVPFWSGHPKRVAQFVLLCDGSRSMLPYAEKFLQFAYALTRQAKQAEVFLFSTRLRRVTPLFRRPPIGVLPKLTELGAEWGGGTRIGRSLAEFVRNDGGRLLTKRTIVVIFSDGLDSEGAESLEWAMKMLHHKSNQVIWLNPLAATKGYKPEARGMKTAWPYIDIFSGVGDRASYSRFVQMIRRGREWR